MWQRKEICLIVKFEGNAMGMGPDRMSPLAFQSLAEACAESLEFCFACVLVNVGICRDDALSVV